MRAPRYFITVCTDNRRHILANASVHESFLCFAQEGPQHGAWVGAYVVMPDHIHALVVLDDQTLDLSTWTKSFKNSISKTLRQIGIAPPHWQKTFFDHVLRSAESYTEKWHYVRENPHGQDWSSADGKTGRSAAKFFRCNIVLNVEDSAVIDRRYSYFGGAADV